VSDRQCDQLDQYLCGFLPPDETARFEAHLAECPACQEQCLLQQRIDRLLAAGTAPIEPAPIALAHRVERKITRLRRRRQLAWAGTLTAAAAGIVVVVSFLAARRSFLHRDVEQPIALRPTVSQGVSKPSPSLSDAQPPAAPLVRVTMVDPSSAIVVPIESHDPNVTLVRIYPTVKVVRQVNARAQP
jgi:anti-sigma factor RsiW